ncbi:MAG: gamma-glutamyltransferase [Phycisphaeraceae bacterium]|nr:gamma-glutamyltransferase [Phycisphaeraceae bacterium]MCW5754029.1 gamma-glutamyltransferase [Phycisphaeraceae bacterium]
MLRLLLIVWVCCAVAASADEPEPWSAVYAREAVAADHALASRAGAEMLALGGNAVDAAVATSFALSVVRPYSCGIGGGGFMVIYLPADPRHGRVETAINYRETCPGAIRPTSYEGLEEEASRVGGMASAVPGTVAGLLYALERYGTLPREVVLAPAIRYAEEGFAVDAHYMQEVRSLIPRFRDDASWRSRFDYVWRIYLHEGHVAQGSKVRTPAQADALRLIARDGAGAMYGGVIGEAIVERIARDGGVMTAADLAAFRVRETAPLRHEVGGRAVLSMPPPSSGGVALVQVLDFMHRTGGWSEDATWAHRLAEGMKHAFADRARYMADPEFVPVPVEALLAEGELAGRALRYDDAGTQAIETYGRAGAPAAEAGAGGGTSHFCVVDRWGGAVSCTETINLAFGAKLAAESFGIVLNNQMDDFTTRPGSANAFGLTQSAANAPEAGKRPLSSMTPTIVLDEEGRVLVVAGASGGPRIISATVQVVARALGGANAGEAVGATRLHHQWSPDIVYVENHLAGDALAARGHTVREAAALGTAQAITRGRDGWHAASDPRKGGKPAGR